MVYELPEGSYKFAISNNGNWAAGNIEFYVNVEERSRSFFRLTAHFADMAAYGQFVMISLSGHLAQVTEHFAISEIESLKFTGVWP